MQAEQSKEADKDRKEAQPDNTAIEDHVVIVVIEMRQNAFLYVFRLTHMYYYKTSSVVGDVTHKQADPYYGQISSL